MDIQLQHDPAATDDLALIGRAADGDLAAFEALMRRHNQQLYRAARSILRDESEAEDAVQEAWWKAYGHLRDFRAEARPATWLTRIAINEALMRRRRNKTREALIQSAYQSPHEHDPMPTHAPDTEAPASAGPDQMAWRAELRRRLERRIDELPDLYRTVFVLRAVDDMPAAEVALVLGLPEATVRVRFMRARRLLQAALQPDFDPRAAGAFSFAGQRCDRIVAGVLARVRAAGG
ncbi:RNA polymerase sigma factor [Castellaniella defragrans]|uniref:RNA polymerase sigma-54 factor RpoN n=1 Tax=Castellaniella defragrans (strain DSM 12143 / CCUG 39792 / 65Phen) TaxID=1437824 RepID=W8X302_CASD6|nr:RNA polymerase sigma factor [Castellaniella defragrans]CDM23882.1 RNA polymerase sigma-54 factor RpoN [Castellaniella defragrans 65Phen]